MVGCEAVDSADGVERALRDLPLDGNYRHEGDEADDVAEWVVPVKWIHTVPCEQALWKTGMFANQNTVTKLRSRFTIEQVISAFRLDD